MRGEASRSTFECPKHMIYGPCGGVGFEGNCEVAPQRCSFLSADRLDCDVVRWPVDPPAHGALNSASRELLQQLTNRQPVVIADFPAQALNSESLARCAELMAGQVAAALVGDSGAARVQFSPAYRAQQILQHGLGVWAGLNCRDRNRVALEGELYSLADVGVTGVHCVTGDHTRTGNRPDAAPVFDLDSTSLAALAVRAGHLVSVGESPTTPPVARRAQRLREKMQTGAQLCFINHCGGVDAVAQFVLAAREQGVTTDFIACVPVILDQASAELVASFTSLVLPSGYLGQIMSAVDTYRAGVAAAIKLADQLLQVEGVRGVNLSGGPAHGAETTFATALAQIGNAVTGQRP